MFSKSAKPLTLEFIKGCALGSAKNTIMKCIKTFDEDFPKIESKLLTLYNTTLILCVIAHLLIINFYLKSPHNNLKVAKILLYSNKVVLNNIL